MLRSSLWFLLLVAPLLERSWGFANSAQNHHRHPVLRFVSAVAPPENTASSEEAGNDNDVNAHNDMVKRTLYEILGATPNATKGELRRKYVALARTTHPDALIGSNATVSYESRSVEFSDIAQAWRVLSNDKERLRYDRSLAAQDFQRSFEQAASSFSKTAGPQLQRVFDEFAVPFLRRTTATTFATVSAAVESTKKGSDLSAALSDAFRAAIRAGRIVDGMELSEKSSELERRAEEEMEKADKVQTELEKLVEARWELCLRTPNSALSSGDALAILKRMNVDDSLSVVGRLSMKLTVNELICELEDTEIEYYEKVAEQTDAKEKKRFTQVALKQAARDAKLAAEAEEAARKALEEAQEKLAAAKDSVNELTKSFNKVESQEQKVDQEVQLMAETLARRQEKIRKALRKKKNPAVDTKAVEDEKLDLIQTLAEIEILRKKERFLAAEHAKGEETVARLLSRASKLQERAKTIDRIKAKEGRR